MSETGLEAQEESNLQRPPRERDEVLQQQELARGSTDRATSQKLEELKMSLKDESIEAPLPNSPVFTIAGPTYERRYAEIAETRYNSGPLAGHGRALIKEAGQISPSASVVEVGCNTGMFLEQWKKETGTNIQGFDINKDAVGTAKSRGLNAEYGLAEGLPLENDSTDLLTSLHTYEHVEDLPKSFREIARVLKPGGKAVIIEPPNLYGLETIRVAIEDMPEGLKGKGLFGFIKTFSNGLRYARRLHRSILGGPFGGARKHAEKILKQNSINLNVRGGMKPGLTFSNLLILEKPAS